MDKSEVKRIYEKCSNCGGNLKFSPDECSLRCENCLSTKLVENKRNVQKNVYFIGVENKAEYNEWTNKNKVFKCVNCGSSLVLNKLQITEVCPYCGGSFASDKKDLAGLKPDGIIPFKFGKEIAVQKYVKGVSKKWFLPNAFKKSPPTDTLKGIYLPSFSYDAFSESQYTGRLATDHTHRDSNGRSHTTTTYRNISGNMAMQHQNILVETSSHLNQVTFSAIKPFDLSELCEFNEGFILGFSVEHYNQSLDDCKAVADNIMNDVIKKTILAGYSYDRVVSFELSTNFTGEKFAYCLLPAYKVDYSYKNKLYTTFMNGQTGKVGSGLPRSKIKITLFTLMIIAIILGSIIAVVALR